MKHIKTNAWHYKLLNKMLDEPIPRSLCPYFWTVVLLMIKLAGGILFGTFILAVFVFIVGHTLLAIFTVIGYNYGINIPGAILLVMVLNFIRVEIRKERLWKEFNNLDDNIEKEDENLFIAYFKAIKEKVCPTLEFVNDDEEL